MFNRRFVEQVRSQLIQVLAQRAREAEQAAAQAGTTAQSNQAATLHYGPEDVVAFVDLQNLHFFLKENCRVVATQVHLPNFLREFGEMHGLPLRDMHLFTGIHDPKREPQRHESLSKRLRWMARCGAKVTALPLSYNLDRVSGEVRAQEKGVDVRLASELLRAVNDGLCKAIVVTQDKDLAEAIFVAEDMAREQGRRFTAFTPALEGATWEHNGRCGMHGLRGTTRLPMSVDLARKHVRPERSSDTESGAEHEHQSASELT